MVGHSRTTLVTRRLEQEQGEDKAHFSPKQDKESADVQLRAFLRESGQR